MARSHTPPVQEMRLEGLKRPGWRRGTRSTRLAGRGRSRRALDPRPRQPARDPDAEQQADSESTLPKML